MATPETAVSRRSVLRTAGGAGAVAGGLALTGPAVAGEHGWEAVDVPISQTLYDVVQTADGPFAVGEGDSSWAGPTTR